jgi:hypothetical protein
VPGQGRVEALPEAGGLDEGVAAAVGQQQPLPVAQSQEAYTDRSVTGAIGRAVLASPMPSRRLRPSPRVVKRAISKYNARGKVDRTTYKATIAIEIWTADQEP